MLIVVCGMKRSGSTLIWQILHSLLSDDPRLRFERKIPQSEFKALASDNQQLAMIKVHYRKRLDVSHFPTSEGQYLYSYRDVRDVVASLFRKARLRQGHPDRGRINAVRHAQREIAGFYHWQQYSNLWIGRYENFLGNTPDLISELAGRLEIPVTPERILEICGYVDLAMQQARVVQLVDSPRSDSTRITNNHITDGRIGSWRETLTKDEIDGIEQVASDWLIANGYSIEDS